MPTGFASSADRERLYRAILNPKPDRKCLRTSEVRPYTSAQRVFLIVDNGSAHRGKRSIDRLQGAWPNLFVVHTPVHASWLNQAEIYFSVVQRKALQPNDFDNLAILEQRLLAFGRRYEQIASPFEWKFTRRDLDTLLDRLDEAPESLELHAA